jgi:hypothetical protein
MIFAKVETKWGVMYLHHTRRFWYSANKTNGTYTVFRSLVECPGLAPWSGDNGCLETNLPSERSAEEFIEHANVFYIAVHCDVNVKDVLSRAILCKYKPDRLSSTCLKYVWR